MALFFLEYDLRKTRDYQKMYDELKKFDAVKILKSLWCFNRINTTVVALRDHFRQFIDNDDGIIVSEVVNWASFNTTGTPNDLK